VQQLRAYNAGFLWCADSELYRSAFSSKVSDINIIANPDGFAFFSGEYEH
jgi:hypothetical protein